MSAPNNVTPSTTQFITQMKLRELRRQREKLREAYRALGEIIARTKTPAARLRKLYEGLREIKFAGQSLHPEVVNLEILLREAEAGAAPEAVVALWQERLHAERASGRLRSEFVYLFGALLEEWARESGPNSASREESARAREEMLTTTLSVPEPNRHRELFNTLFDEMEPGLTAQGERLRGLMGDMESLPAFVPVWVDQNPLNLLLKRISGDVYQSPHVRNEARHFSNNLQLFGELTDALRILISERATWDWPSEGLRTRSLWARIRWRLYLDTDLPNVCLLQTLGKNLASLIEQQIADSSTLQQRRSRVRKLITIRAPESIVEFTQGQLQDAEQVASLEGYEPAGLWGSLESESSNSDDGEAEYGSVVEKRRKFTQILRKTPQGGYEDDYEENAANPVIRLVNAEVRLARSAFPDRPLYVVKADLRDFYARIPHDAILTILERLGIAVTDRQFFARFLTPPLRTNTEDTAPVRMTRGVPMNFTLSALFADLLLRLMERYIRQGARVRIIRQIDDICLLTPHVEDAVAGWQRIHEFCDACGLEVNNAKSGAVCLGGALPEGLPTDLPRWGMLELDAIGEWRVHRPTFDAYRERSRQRVLDTPSLLSRVQLYNADAQYLANTLCLGANLGDTHRREVYEAVRHFHQSFFAPDQGIVAGLRETIRERFPLDDDREEIPDAWLYWPITAGGLGLKNPLLIAGQYAEAYDMLEKPAVPTERDTDWENESNDWSRFYETLLDPLSPDAPTQTPVMQTLTNDFIKRGGEITAGAQKDLSPYWRWVLYTYGPQILQRFGTFRFLITELVPLQLISQQRVGDSDGGSASGASADFTDNDLGDPFAE
jgi:hypothetical protein